MLISAYPTRLGAIYAYRRSVVAIIAARNYGMPADPGRSTRVPRKGKLFESADEAVADIKSGDILLCGGLSPPGADRIY
jgi:3-oxoacid CoA-transferase